MSLAKYLVCGRLKINYEQRCLEIGDKDLIIPYEKISPTDWGIVYEKYVGQVFEEEGYAVTYHGLDRGLFDRGIDIIAENDSNLLLIQCKFLRRKISKRRIDWILYKASNALYRQYKSMSKKIVFVLVVKDKDTNFSKWVPFNFRLTFTPRNKIKYPILQYFLDHNYVQDKVKLEFREIRMDI